MKFSKKIKKNVTEGPESQKWLWLQLGVGVVMTVAVAALYILDARENQAASAPQSEHHGHKGAGPNQASMTSAAPSPAPRSMSSPCTCGGEHSPRVRLDQAKIVFSGVVLEVNDEAVKLVVEKTYKGDVENEIVLTQSNPKTTCDILFSTGGKYLVYADEVRLDDKVVFMTDVCAGTARYADAKEDIEYLESPALFPEFRKLDPPKSIKARPSAEPERRKP